MGSTCSDAADLASSLSLRSIFTSASFAGFLSSCSILSSILDCCLTFPVCLRLSSKAGSVFDSNSTLGMILKESSVDDCSIYIESSLLLKKMLSSLMMFVSPVTVILLAK